MPVPLSMPVVVVVVEVAVAATTPGKISGGRVAGVWSAGTGDEPLPMGVAETTAVGFGAAPGDL